MIEARWLFDVSPEKIEVLIHPQSIIHSMVEYVRWIHYGSVRNAGYENPVIQYAITYPSRQYSPLLTRWIFKIQQGTYF